MRNLNDNRSNDTDPRLLATMAAVSQYDTANEADEVIPAVIYPEWEEALRHLAPDVHARAWMMIVIYAFYGKLEEEDPVILAVTSLMLRRIDQDREKYRQSRRRRTEISEKRAEAGRRGGMASRSAARPAEVPAPTPQRAAIQEQAQTAEPQRAAAPHRPAAAPAPVPQRHDGAPAPAAPSRTTTERVEPQPVADYDDGSGIDIMQVAPAIILRASTYKIKFVEEFLARHADEAAMLCETYETSMPEIEKQCFRALAEWNGMNQPFRDADELDRKLLTELNTRLQRLSERQTRLPF